MRGRRGSCAVSIDWGTFATLELKARGLAAAFFACAVFAAFPIVATQAQAASEVTPLLVTAQGTWSASVNYITNDLVTSRGSAWRAKRASKGKLPGSTSPSTAADWEQFAAGLNPLGAWKGSTKISAHRSGRSSRRNLAGAAHQPQQGSGDVRG